LLQLHQPDLVGLWLLQDQVAPDLLVAPDRLEVRLLLELRLDLADPSDPLLPQVLAAQPDPLLLPVQSALLVLALPSGLLPQSGLLVPLGPSDLSDLSGLQLALVDQSDLSDQAGHPQDLSDRLPQLGQLGPVNRSLPLDPSPQNQ